MGKKGIKKLNGRNNYQFLDSALANSDTYYDYLDRFKQVALSQFEWINLPETMNADFLEKCLYYFGEASLLKTKDYGFINTKCCTNGRINIYELPTNLNCFSVGFQASRKLYNGFSVDEEDEEYNYCILVKNNFDKLPTAPSMELFAYRLYQAERCCDVNIKNSKFPMIFAGDESMKLFFANLYEKYDGNEPVMFIDKKQLGEMAFRTIKTDSPFLVDKIMNYKKEIWNEALTYLGINNIHVEKKERLISGEVDSNNELINLNLQSRLAVRKKACDQFNKFFKLEGKDKIDVKVRSDLTNYVKMMENSLEEKEMKEGEEDGTIYNRTSQNN